MAPIKTFTIEEANSIIPLLERGFAVIMDCRKRQKLLNRDIEDLHEIWGDQIFDEKNIDNKFYLDKLRKKDLLASAMQKEAARVRQMGCLIKDAENGLVDFYYDRSGELVFLCWRYGEREITHWHSLDSGFSGRRHIETLRPQQETTRT